MSEWLRGEGWIYWARQEDGSLKPIRWLHEYSLCLLFLLLLVVADFLVPDFVSHRSQLLLSRPLWEIAILALGMTLIIITGGIDLSVGSAMGMCAITFGWVFFQTQSATLAGLACIVVGGLGGMINGTLVARLRIHPLIVTLATYAVFRGIAEGASQGREYSPFPDTFTQLARKIWLGIPLPGVVFLILVVAVALLLHRTATGRYLYAIGHNERAARFSGVRVDRVKFGLYTFSGLLAGVATVLHVSRFGTARANAGTGFELDVVTAVIVGGTSIFGGRGNVVGTMLGLLLIHETRQFVSLYWRINELNSIVVGTLLIVSILIYRILARRDVS